MSSVTGGHGKGGFTETAADGSVSRPYPFATLSSLRRYGNVWKRGRSLPRFRLTIAAEASHWVCFTLPL
jgi:hypothetical protein